MLKENEEPHPKLLNQSEAIFTVLIKKIITLIRKQISAIAFGNSTNTAKWTISVLKRIEFCYVQ